MRSARRGVDLILAGWAVVVLDFSYNGVELLYDPIGHGLQVAGFIVLLVTPSPARAWRPLLVAGGAAAIIGAVVALVRGPVAVPIQLLAVVALAGALHQQARAIGREDVRRGLARGVAAGWLLAVALLAAAAAGRGSWTATDPPARIAAPFLLFIAAAVLAMGMVVVALWRARDLAGSIDRTHAIAAS